MFALSAFALIVVLTVYGSAKTIKPEKVNYETALRLVGHKLLLSSGDKTSRIMPIKKLSEKEFQIYFENPITLESDSILNIISNTIKLTSLPGDYTTNVLDCSENNIVYSFAISESGTSDMVPCLGRAMPKGCYYINIAFSSPSANKKKMMYALGAGFLSMALVIFSGYFYLNRKKIVSTTGNKESITNENVMPIGRFLFHPDQRYLELDGTRVDLTDKESKLLAIFAANTNEIIEREKLQKEVWENEGVIVTRSLDVFISRLRKKLEKDNSIKLVNIHGKGYKLETL